MRVQARFIRNLLVASALLAAGGMGSWPGWVWPKAG